MTSNGRRFRTFVGTVAVAGATALWSPAAASACSGGMEFDWAVAHTRGWIATATVVEAVYVPDGFYRVRLAHLEPVKGNPPALRQVTVAMGAVCDQSADAGERILLLDGVAVEPPYDKPVAYVISGSDAVPAAEVARVLRSLPSTDTTPDATAIRPRRWDPASGLIAIGLAAVWLAMRWFARRTAAQIGSPGSRLRR
jgi:hypothetical protein